MKAANGGRFATQMARYMAEEWLRIRQERRRHRWCLAEAGRTD